MPNLVDLIGRRFGRLTVLKRAENHNGRVAWLCECVCGRVKKATGNMLISGHVASCGCLKRDLMSERSFVHGRGHEDPTYRAWDAAKKRCFSTSNTGFKNYGGRGITMCEEWRTSFAQFLLDMGNKPSKDATLERKDNDGPYAPWNCIWATQKVQSRNTRRNVWFVVNGKRMVAKDFARMAHVSENTIRKWIDRGKSKEWIIEHFMKGGGKNE